MGDPLAKLQRTERLRGGIGPHHRVGDTIVYDPTNERIIVIGGDARMLVESPFWVSMNDVWAFNTNTGTWTELLAQSTP